MLSTAGHHQSPYAALENGSCSRGSYRDMRVHHTSYADLNGPQTKSRGFIATGTMIVQRETPLALYKGLGAVLSGIVPKMAIRFASFETYKGWLSDKTTGKTGVGSIFLGAFLSASERTMKN